MTRPLIAVSAPLEPLSTAFGELDCTKLVATYTDAIYAAGGQPVILPVVEQPPKDMLARMDGLLLTGGGDVDPALYGETPDPSVYGVRRDRDAFETALYREAVARALPILGICRGMQLVNVLRGGTLIQEVGGHWQLEPATEPSHDVDVSAGTSLADAMGSCAPVNSFHHQALGDIGTALRVTAVCGDVVEAVEATDVDLVGVAWHPELLAPTDPRQKAIFESFLKKAAATSEPASTRR
jgi:putative glutamine amidotransferase